MLKSWMILLLFFCAFAFSQEEDVPSPENNECEEVCCEHITLTLDTAISRALNFNRQLFNSVDAKIKSEYAVALAESEFEIKIVPNGRAGYVGGGREGDGSTIGVGADFNKRFQNGTRISVSPSLLRGPDHYYNDVAVTITQPLLRGLGREYQLSGLRGAEYGFRSSLRGLFTSQLQLIVKTISSLYDVVKAKKNVELNTESFTRVQKSYQAAKLKEKIGLSDGMDVYRAETELQQAEDQLVSAQERLQEVEDNLKDLLAYPLDTCIEVEVPLIYTPNNTCAEEAIKLALANRVEMDQAEDQWQENIRLSKMAKENLWPEMNVVLNYSNRGRDPYFGRSWTCHREDMWGVGFTTSTDFNLYGEKIAYEQSLMSVQAAERNMDQVKANLILDVKRALRNLQRADKKIALQEKQIHTAEGQMYLSKLKFDRGMANNFDVIQAEKNLRNAQVTYWNAIIEHIVGEYQFLLATGMLIDKPCIQ